VRSYRFAWRPAWIAGHLLVLAAAVTMVLLGRWQLDVSQSKHFSLQNFGYALQWWAFTIAALFIWARIVRDHARPSENQPAQPAETDPTVEPPVAYRRYVMPTSVETDDPELARYNAYLRSLEGK
jgi:DNA-binding transcriptional regulator of glucitol operon